MRKRILVLTLLAGAGFLAASGRTWAQTTAPSQTASQQLASEDEEAGLRRWKLINSGIFLLLVGFAVVKLGPRFFQARSLDIQKAIKEATGLKIEADFRYSEIDKRMANLSSEVDRLKAEGAAEMEREHGRVNRDTAEQLEHISHNTEYEIESLRSDGALQVRRHTAQLALALAERRLQAYFAQHDGQDNLQEFVNLVGSDAHLGGKN